MLYVYVFQRGEREESDYILQSSVFMQFSGFCKKYCLLHYACMTTPCGLLQIQWCQEKKPGRGLGNYLSAYTLILLHCVCPWKLSGALQRARGFLVMLEQFKAVYSLNVSKLHIIFSPYRCPLDTQDIYLNRLQNPQWDFSHSFAFRFSECRNKQLQPQKEGESS